MSITVHTTARTGGGVTITLELQSDGLVPLLFIDSPLDGRFSDNSFLLLPTEVMSQLESNLFVQSLLM